MEQNEKPLKLSEVETHETERVMAQLMKEDQGVNVLFKDSFFDAIEALQGRR